MILVLQHGAKVGLITRHVQRPSAKPTRLSSCLEFAQTRARSWESGRASSGKGQEKRNEIIIHPYANKCKCFTARSHTTAPGPQFRIE